MNKMMNYKVLDENGKTICTINLAILLEIINHYKLTDLLNEAIIEENKDSSTIKLDAYKLEKLFNKLATNLKKLRETWSEKEINKYEKMYGKDFKIELEEEFQEYEKYNLIRNHIKTTKVGYLYLKRIQT